MTAPKNIIKGHCPKCGSAKNADILAKHMEEWQDEEEPIWGQVDYRILQCRGCDEIYFQRAEACSEHVDHTGEYQIKATYWPSPLKRPRPFWYNDLMLVDANLHRILKEVYLGLDNGLSVLSATGMRTAFDRATEILGVDPAMTFQEKLEALRDAGKVGATEMEALKVLSDAGSAAAHRGWKPRSGQLSTMMDIVEAFCYRNFFLDGEVGVLKPHIPAKQKRRPAGKGVKK